MKKNISYFLTLLLNLNLILNFASCNTTDPKLEPELILKLEDVSCTEAWLQFSSTNIQIPNNISLLINGNVDKTFSLNTQDTLLYVDSLLPNQNYKFKVVLNTTNNAQPTTNEVIAITMDTTSHNFTWQTFEFGIQTNVSILFDVAIIDENNIWAVGAIYMNDSTGNPDPNAYNAVHWDGYEWKLYKLQFYTFCGQSNTGSYPAKAIFALDENNIIISSGSQLTYLDDDVQLKTECVPVSTGKIWGKNISDLYIVGNGGGIAIYNGSNWTKIESETNLTLSDIVVNNAGEIYVCGGNSAFGQGIILKSSNGFNFSTFIEGANIPESQLFNPNLYGAFSSLWFDQNNTLYAGGNILFQYKFNRWSYVKSLPENYIGGNPNTYYRGFIDKVRGNASNDMWIVGDRNTVRHFNGVTWRQIGMPYDPQVDMVWRGMDCKDNLTVLVGSHDNKAIIMMIKK